MKMMIEFLILFANRKIYRNWSIVSDQCSAPIPAIWIDSECECRLWSVLWLSFFRSLKRVAYVKYGDFLVYVLFSIFVFHCAIFASFVRLMAADAADYSLKYCLYRSHCITFCLIFHRFSISLLHFLLLKLDLLRVLWRAQHLRILLHTKGSTQIQLKQTDS